MMNDNDYINELLIKEEIIEKKNRSLEESKKTIEEKDKKK